MCLVMEHAGGGELFQQIARTGALSEETARIYFQQIISAIHYCHSIGICHRDLKLENCLLAAPGSHLLKVADFGLSKDAQQHSQPRTKRVGTISYMAPEVALATGTEPYDGEVLLPSRSQSALLAHSIQSSVQWPPNSPFTIDDEAAAVGQAADVWSLGVMLFVLLCCEYPFGFDGPAEQGGQPTQR